MNKVKAHLSVYGNYFMLLYSLIYFLPLTLWMCFGPVFRKIFSALWNPFGQALCGTDCRVFPHYGLEDTAFQYVYTGLCLIISLVMAGILTTWQPRAQGRAAWWWHNIGRISIAWWLFCFGIFKVIPVQVAHSLKLLCYRDLINGLNNCFCFIYSELLLHFK